MVSNKNKDELKKKRRNKRKSRTEVSLDAPSSSSSGESEKESSPVPPPSQKKTEPKPTDIDLESEQDLPAPSEVAIPKTKFKDPNQAFEEFYLKQAAKEFANDLDKLRSAGDFRDDGNSLGIIVRGLRVGVRGFGEGEKRNVVEGS